MNSQVTDSVTRSAPADSLVQGLADLWERGRVWLERDLLRWSTLAELVVIVAAALLALAVWARIKKPFDQRLGSRMAGTDYLAKFVRTVRRVTPIGLATAFVAVARLVYSGLDLHPVLLDPAIKLGAAWVLIRLCVILIPNRLWARIVAVAIWFGVALSVVKLLGTVTQALDTVGMTFGGVWVSLLSLGKALLLGLILVQAATVLTRFFGERIQATDQMSPSVRVLLTKTVTVSLYAAALLIALSGLGIDLTSLALFSGAIGVGIGFGLQKVFSNLVSGVILLVDKSIKPGDTIEMSGVFGRVENISARYTSVLTRDGKEFLVPNENFIANEVINWSHGDSNVRVKIPVGVSYGADLRLVEKLLYRALEGVPRVLADPEPMVRLVGFGDSSVDFDIRIWLDDPMSGVANVTSDILFRVWDLFKEHDIEIPFPQRDLHVKSLPAGAALEKDKE